MKQLVQLQKQAEEFKALNAEMIFVFREEKEGVAGLQKIKAKTSTTFTLCVDLDKTSTAAYSTKKMTFDNYVIAKDGTVKSIMDGTLKERASADAILTTLKQIETP